MQIKIGRLSTSTQNSTVIIDESKGSFYFLILCRQLLSLERYRRKKGVEVKVHCRFTGVQPKYIKGPGNSHQGSSWTKLVFNNSWTTTIACT